ncbi:hypothetical protein H4W32_000209 [Actinophytocola algeriensis]|nr:hypothetical protein [Actinophytocola algeriensis]
MAGALWVSEPTETASKSDGFDPQLPVRLDRPWPGTPTGAVIGLVPGERRRPRARARLAIVVIAIAATPISAAVV